jgi:serine/threonine protein phosphatase PrpC
MKEDWSAPLPEDDLFAPEKERAFNLPVSSKELDPMRPHKIGKISKYGIEGIFLNEAHMQDAFSIQGDVVVVCDGVSQEPWSGVFSPILADKMAKGVQASGLSAVSESLIQETIDESMRHPDVDASTRVGFMSTFIAAMIDKEQKVIRFASLGDSPLLVVDRNKDGTIARFEIANDEWVISNEDYVTLDNIGYLSSPLTDCIGIHEHDGDVVTNVDKAKRGSIPYKEGRVVILATDFLTKMLLLSPEATSKKRISPDDLELVAEYAKVRATFENISEDLWVENPATGKKMLNPLFFLGQSKAELAILLQRWKAVGSKRIGRPGNDDATMIAIDMDTVFAEKTA